MTTRLDLGGISVDVVFKDIKNVHLSVYPPTGRVRISAPTRMKLDTVRVFAIAKLNWIKEHQHKLRKQERETPREYLDRESHYLWGKRYLLKISESDEAPSVEVKGKHLVLRVRPGADEQKKRDLVEEWYRDQVKEAVPAMIAKWEHRMGVKVARVFVQRMKTKWGSCNSRSHSIRLNTDLAKKPLECVEYVVVHEMAHLIVRNHNDRFRSVMDECLPTWRQLQQMLNSAPLAHADWAS